MKGMIVILSGPSGAGKGRITSELMKRRDNVKKILSVTSRPKRPEDMNKDNYVFVSDEEFVKMREQGKFFESNFYDGHWYGTLEVPVSELENFDIIFDKDVNGALAIKAKYPEAITIYIMAPDNETLLKRRGERGEARADIAISEVPKAKELDFLIVNSDAEESVKQVEAIIECMRECSMKNKWNKEFLDTFY